MVNETAIPRTEQPAEPTVEGSKSNENKAAEQTPKEEKQLDLKTEKLLKQIERSADMSDVRKFMTEAVKKYLDGDLAGKEQQVSCVDIVIRALTKKRSAEPELAANCAEVKKLLESLPSLLNNFSVKIKEIVHNKEAGFDKIEEKFSAVIEALVGPVLEGHLEAEDVTNLIRKIEIVDSLSGTAASGDDGITYHDKGQIFITKEALKDIYDGDKILDIKHLMTHEISHSVVDQGVLNDPNLVKKIEELMAMPDFFFIHPQYAGQICKNMANIDSDFAKLDSKGKEFFKNDKEAYRKARHAQAIEEIATDYMAIYLKSNGDENNFAQEAVKMATLSEEGARDFEVKFEMERYGESGEHAGQIKFNKLMENPLFQDAMKIYKTIFGLMATDVKKLKGNTEPIEGKEIDENEFFGYSGNVEPSTGFSAPASGKGGPSMASELWDLLGAFADEAAGGLTPK